MSVKISRFSNIHSWTRIEPSAWVASATAIEVEVGRERGPRPVLDLALVLADVGLHDELLPAGHEHVVAVELRAQPDALEHEPDHAQVAGHRVLDPQLAAGDAGERHEAADLDVVGGDVVLAAVQALGAVDGDQVGADALDVGAHLHEHAREVLHVGLAGGVADDGRAGRQRGGHQRVLGRHHRGLVHEDVGRAQPARRAQHDLAVAVGVGAHRAERVEVRVQAAAADHVAAGRRHHRAVEAGEQRPGEQERGADQLGELALDLDARARRRRTARPRWARASCTSTPIVRRICEHRLDVADARHVAHDDLVLGEDGGGEDGQGAVLVAGRDHRAGQRDAAFDDELLHELGAPPRHQGARWYGARQA